MLSEQPRSEEQKRPEATVPDLEPTIPIPSPAFDGPLSSESEEDTENIVYQQYKGTPAFLDRIEDLETDDIFKNIPIEITDDIMETFGTVDIEVFLRALSVFSTLTCDTDQEC